MANYKYLKENNLLEAHMKYMRTLGESFGYSPIEEADDDENQQQNAPGQDPMGGMPPMGAPDGGAAPDANAMGGAQNPMDGGAPMPDGGGMPTPTDGGMNPNDGAQPTDAPMPMGGDMPEMDEEEPKEEDEVIDVDDITNAQEKTNDKVNSVGRDLGKVDARIEKLIGAIETLQGMFDKNNQEIADLKSEFEKRNPTQTEKLNLRSLDSYPFKVKPTDYWREKSENGNYSAYADNEEPTTQEYVITNDDVDDFTEREMADSFNVIDDELNQDIKKIFGL